MIGRHARLVVLCIFALSLALQAASTATEKVIYRFSGSGRDGYGPISKLVMDASGRLFGTTQYGGDPTCRCGTVFELTAPDANGNRKYLLLHDLKGGNDGRIPVGDLVMDSQGNLYGIAQQDGFYGSGVALLVAAGQRSMEVDDYSRFQSRH